MKNSSKCNLDRKVIIHTGYFKTGTTWFQEVFFTKVNNVNFSNQANASLDDHLILTRPFDFSTERVTSFINKLFSDNSSKTILLSRERLSGHPFTGGYDAKIIADRLKLTFPKAIVVIFIREQKDAIISTYKEYVKRGGVAPFEKWIYTKERTIPGFQLDHFAYHKHINYYFKLFGKTNVKVYAYEDFKEDPAQFLKGFSEELNLEIDLSLFDFNKKINRGYSTKSMKIIRWSNKFSKNKNLNPYPAVKIPFLRFCIEKMCKVLDAAFYHRMDTNFMNQKISIDLENKFSTSNYKLNQLLNIDIKSKGYICANSISNTKC